MVTAANECQAIGCADDDYYGQLFATNSAKTMPIVDKGKAVSAANERWLWDPRQQTTTPFKQEANFAGNATE
eukprot:scaffold39119_cov18-Prasinocladus_malaysianus.AAC.1